MPTMFNWIIERSGAGLRVRGIHCDENNIPTENYKLTGITSIEVVHGAVVAYRKTTRVAVLDTRRLDL